MLEAAVIGAGNISAHLTPRLADISIIDLKYIHSRKFQDAEQLATHVNSKAVKNLSDIPTSIDVIFIWVTDDQIVKVSSQLAENGISKGTLIVHSSGTKSLDSIDDYFENTAVLWPIQSFSKLDAYIDLKTIPFCIMGLNHQSELKINKIADALSNRVMKIDQAQKAKLHMAAVFANNFSNHLLHIVEQILAKEGLAFDIMFPILDRTIEKVKELSPANAQTGPAIRGDEKTMQSHLELLVENEDLAAIYRILSDHIIKLNDK